MKSSASRCHFPIEIDPRPFLSNYVVYPHIVKVEISNALASLDYQVGIMKLARMIGPLPRRWILLIRSLLPPFLCFPVQNWNCIKTLTILWPSSKQNNLIRLFTVVDAVVRSLLWRLSSCMNNIPCIILGGEEPQIIEILPFSSRASKASKEHDFVVIDE